MALKNIAEILTIASAGLKTIYKIDEGSQSKPTPTPIRNPDRGAPTKPTKK